MEPIDVTSVAYMQEGSQLRVRELALDWGRVTHVRTLKK